MRIHCALLILMTCRIAFGQLTLSEADMPNNNTRYLYEITGDLNFEDYSLTGANYTWNYSSATALSVDTVLNATISSTPFAYQFFFNNPILYPLYTADLAIVGANLNIGAQVTVEDRFDFYKKNTGSYQIVGYGAEVNSLPASIRYDTIDQVYPLPMTYNTSDSTRAYYLTTVPTLGTYGQSIQRRVLVDGYGVLETPIDNYPDVIRVKTTLYQRDTVYVDQFMFGTAIDRPVETIYEWWENGTGAPLMKVNISAGIVTSAKYYLTSGLSITENEHTKMELTPRGNRGEFNVLNASGSPIKEWYAFDLSGRKVKATLHNSILKIHNISNQVAIVSLKLENGKIWSQKINLK